MKRIAITGTGSYVPEKVLSNHDIEKFLDTSDEWIYTRTGIRERRIADPGTATSDLSKIACERAMEMAGVTKDDIDLIVLATITPDTHCPAGPTGWRRSSAAAMRSLLISPRHARGLFSRFTWPISSYAAARTRWRSSVRARS